MKQFTDVDLSKLDLRRMASAQQTNKAEALDALNVFVFGLVIAFCTWLFSQFSTADFDPMLDSGAGLAFSIFVGAAVTAMLAAKFYPNVVTIKGKTIRSLTNIGTVEDKDKLVIEEAVREIYRTADTASFSAALQLSQVDPVIGEQRFQQLASYQRKNMLKEYLTGMERLEIAVEFIHRCHRAERVESPQSRQSTGALQD